MIPEKHIDAFFASFAVGLIVFFLCGLLSITAAVAGAFLGSYIAMSVFKFLVRDPQSAFNLPETPWIFFPVMMWTFLAMIFTYVFVLVRAVNPVSEAKKASKDSKDSV